MKFDELNLTENVRKAIDDMGFEDMTYVQENVLPHALKKKDVVGQAPTGSGKTLAFTLPIAESITPGQGLQALVICPTRELAIQVAEVMKETGKHMNIKTLPVYGGASINPQIQHLRKADVVVGTPGRLLDHIGRRTMRLDKIKVLVLDEADRMLDMGFIEDIKKIVRQMPRTRQTLFFSATIPPVFRRFSDQFMKNPIQIHPNGDEDKPIIDQSYIVVSNENKFKLLLALIDRHQPESAIVFVNTKIMADLLGNNLMKNDLNALAIHGDLSQAKREVVMEEFKSGNLRFLIATDVASRGLDIPQVSHIYNYDIPQDADDYVHRIGRTARAGRKGNATCLLSNADHMNMRHVLERHPELKAEKINWDPFNYPSIDHSLKSDFMKRTRRGGNRRRSSKPRRGNTGQNNRAPSRGTRRGGPRRR